MLSALYAHIWTQVSSQGFHQPSSCWGSAAWLSSAQSHKSVFRAEPRGHSLLCFLSPAKTSPWAKFLMAWLAVMHLTISFLHSDMRIQPGPFSVSQTFAA
jgi:hypothetical protein